MPAKDLNDLHDMQRYLVEEEAEKWQEGRITRRELLRRVTLIVGGAAAANSVLLSMGCDSNSPASPTVSSTSQTPSNVATPSQGSVSPYHVAENDAAITAQMAELPSSDPSTKLQAYVAMPASLAGSSRLPGVLVIHENRGLTEHIKDVVRRLAKANYVALCVDLLSRQGGTASHSDEAERTGIIGQMPPDQVITDLSGGLEYLKAAANVEPGRLGVVGFCFGGGYAWRMATKRTDLKAAVAFYGPNPPLEEVPNIKAAVLGIYGETDQRITSKAPELEEALKKAGITYEVKVYPGAGHAFHNDTGAQYNLEVAKDAWAKTLDWFGKRL